MRLDAGGRAEAGFDQFAGEPLPEFAGIYARMMFIRVAVLGGAVVPEVSVRAGQGPAVVAGAQSRPVFRATAASGAGTGFVGDVFLVPAPEGVVQFVVGFDRDTTEEWGLGIRNTDPGTERWFTWVVADNDAEVVDPWAWPPAWVPEIEQMNPRQGAPGTEVALTGRTLLLGTPQVFFGDREAVLLRKLPLAQALAVAVPEGLVATGQPGADVPVAVRTAAGKSDDAVTFRVLAPEVVLVGHPDHGLAGIAGQLRGEGSMTVSIGPEGLSDSTGLLLSVVDCRDGPMPALRESLRALDGRVVARAAVLLTNTDTLDPELADLVELEVLELHAAVGIAPLESGNVIRLPGQQLVPEVGRVLAQPRRDFHVVVPA
ncbi:hypothetical protein LVY72_10880 [Arthrobacter sp. I2-34]|uniref:Uncharacterized protein n=1 Tax=Arthrobacter hankyongi TaxID=2904801 RepID=A0ABS9L720_9MICC|nr:hypothetical protein [Arthrobacter hankyongi]MCG2622416.1 hypothetical protein [Arthrobacter hankyongi]